MKTNRIFKTTETPCPAVDAVLNHGFAAIDHDTSLALTFGKRVIEAKPSISSPTWTLWRTSMPRLTEAIKALT